jgi:hypothetical protein
MKQLDGATSMAANYAGNKVSGNPLDVSVGSGVAVAQAGISGARAIMPGLNTSKETEQVENNVLGGAGTGAGSGAMIGGLIGMIGGPAGVACGAAIGGALGGGAGAVLGAT